MTFPCPSPKCRQVFPTAHGLNNHKRSCGKNLDGWLLQQKQAARHRPLTTSRRHVAMDNVPPQPEVRQQSEPGLNHTGATVEVTKNDEVTGNDMSTGPEVVSSSPSLGSGCMTYNF